MNEFMEVFNDYGWSVFYFAGFVMGSLISIIVAMLCDIADALTEFVKDRKKKGTKNEN